MDLLVSLFSYAMDVYAILMTTIILRMISGIGFAGFKHTKIFRTLFFQTVDHIFEDNGAVCTNEVRIYDYVETYETNFDQQISSIHVRVVNILHNTTCCKEISEALFYFTSLAMFMATLSIHVRKG